jgi:hypothetical protein
MVDLDELPTGTPPATAARARALLLGAVLAALLCALALSATASANFAHQYATQITEANGEPLGQPWGLTFAGASTLFAADPRSPAGPIVDEFSSFTNSFTERIGATDFSLQRRQRAHR